MTIGNNISKGYINIVDKDVHKGRLTSLNLERHSENLLARQSAGLLD